MSEEQAGISDHDDSTEELFSTVEDLDPEPPPKRSWRFWDVGLGLLLLVTVLGVAGWEWYHQNQQQSDYEAGTTAMARRDWDAAQSHFAAASGYRDADKQAQVVATQVAQRNAQYNVALASQDKGDWIACLQAVQQVGTIEPGYEDSPQIEKQATDQLYSGALSGTVALRTDANPPGLYYYGASGWVWLPKSDAYSRIQGGGPSDWLLYDVLGAAWVAPSPTPSPPVTISPTPSPTSSTINSPQLKGRRLMAARLPDLSQSVDLSIDPEQYYYFAWGKDALWAFHDAGTHESDRLPVGPQYWPNSTATYESYKSDVTATVKLNRLPTKAMVMEVDPTSSRYLLGTWFDDYQGVPVTNTVTSLYLATAGAQDDPQLLYTMTGGSFASAQFGPDGRHVLLRTYSYDFQHKTNDYAAEKQTMLLLSIDGTSAPRTIAETTVDSGQIEYARNDHLVRASFVTGGPYSGEILAVEFDGDHYTVSRIDTQTGARLMSLDVPGKWFLSWSQFEGHNGEVVLVGQNYDLRYASNTGTTRPDSIVFIVLSPGMTPRVTTLTIDEDQYVTAVGNATIVGNQLVFSVYANEMRSVYAFPTDRLGSQRASPKASSIIGLSGQKAYADYTQSFGLHYFANRTGNDLYVRPYDAFTSILLAHNISYLYDTSQKADWQTSLR